MKIKQIIAAVLITSLVSSCSKQDITVPQPQNTIKTDAVAITSTITSESNNVAYIFVEPNTKSKQKLIVNYLKDSVTHSVKFPFLGFNLGNGISVTNKDDILNYIDLKYWYNGELPAVRTTKISQSTHLMDSLIIDKSTINDNSVWVTILIPISAMSNDKYKQSYINISGTGLQTSKITLNSTIYGYLLDYNGNYLPKGKYRLYTTFVSPALRFDMSKPGNIYLKGVN